MKEMMKKAAFHNLGCKVNSYELDIMRQILRDQGYLEVPFHEPADVYVVNTCTVTNIADRKSRQMLHRAKKQNPGAVVVAVGCYVETDPDRVERDEAIDLVIGTHEKGELVPAKIIDHFEDVESQKEAAGMFQTDFETKMSTDEREKAFTELIYKIKEYSIERRMRGLTDVNELQKLVKEKKKWQNPGNLHISFKDGYTG